jgi:threonylcarbamoyladenosine tRNA methylthiotransferase MtaB
VSVEVVTFGCRLNTQESAVMKRLAEDAGRDHLTIVNTCAVTAESVAQARQAIRRLAREHPERRIVATGCAAQIEPQTFAAMPEVAEVLGNAEKLSAVAWLHPATERVRVNDIMETRAFAPHMADALEGRARAIVQVQNGCDHRCTFCIIPYGRGNARSAAVGDVVEQVKRLVSVGYLEVVLTGVDLTSWGGDLPGTPRLGRLVGQILKHVPELARLRLSSIDSIEADPELMELIGGEPRFAPHLHLSLQAGDDLILKRMKRRHLRDDAIRFCEEARRLRPDIVFGADLIAGFPTEDEAMFDTTLKLVEECGLTHLHVFPFSARKGTPAARMPQVRCDIARDRAARLRALGERRLGSHLDRQVGRRLALLTERGGVGRAADFTLVKLPAELPPGQIIAMEIAGHDGRRLMAA